MILKEDSLTQRILDPLKNITDFSGYLNGSEGARDHREGESLIARRPKALVKSTQDLLGRTHPKPVTDMSPKLFKLTLRLLNCLYLVVVWCEPLALDGKPCKDFRLHSTRHGAKFGCDPIR